MILIQGKNSSTKACGKARREEKIRISWVDVSYWLMPAVWPSLRFPKAPCSLFLGTRELKNEQHKPRETVEVTHISRYEQPHTKEKTVLDILISCFSCHFLFSALDKHKWRSNKHMELLCKSFPALPLWPQHFSLCSLYCPSFYHITYLQHALIFKPTMPCLS